MKSLKKSFSFSSHSGLSSEKPSEMRIILLGYKTSGKSSSGNTILGSEQFSLETTVQCEKRQGDVAGRHVTVVNTPGWFNNVSLNKTPELIKQEIVLSASLCPPGPHALLLVIPVDVSLTADRYKYIEDHMELLGPTVWSHTMILFTYGDLLGGTFITSLLGGKSVKKYIKSEGKGLQRLLEKCGDRYHVFNNKNRGDDTQVTELLQKVEEMGGDKGGCFEMDRAVLEETEEKRRTQDEGATQRQMKVKKEREIIRSRMGDDLHLSEMRIIVLGLTGNSESGNSILCSEQFCKETAQCEKRQGDVAGRHITVVNTPGWFYFHSLTSELIKQEIVLSPSLCPPGPHALLLVLPADLLLTADEYKYIEDHMQLLCPKVWSHTMILFNRVDLLGGKSIEHFIESEGEVLQRLVEKCGNRYHVLDIENRGDGSQVTELLQKIEEMVAGNGGRLYGTGSPATPTPDTRPKALKPPVPAKPKALKSPVPDTSLFLDVTHKYTKEIEDNKRQQQQLTRDLQELRNHAEKLTVQKECEDNKRQQKLIQEQQQSLSNQVEKLTVQMQNMQAELERTNQRLTEADRKHTSLFLDTQKNTKEIEDSKRRQHQLDQDHQEMRTQHPVLDSQVKNLTAQFEESRFQMQSELEKISQRQTEADKKRASAARHQLTHGEAAKKLMSVREQFVQRISESTLHSLLDKLLTKSVISDDEMEAAKLERLRADKARYVIDTVRRKGNKASSEMIDMIDQLDRNLSELFSPAD